MERTIIVNWIIVYTVSAQCKPKLKVHYRWVSVDETNDDVQAYKFILILILTELKSLQGVYLYPKSGN